MSEVGLTIFRITNMTAAVAVIIMSGIQALNTDSDRWLWFLFFGFCFIAMLKYVDQEIFEQNVKKGLYR